MPQLLDALSHHPAVLARQPKILAVQLPCLCIDVPGREQPSQAPKEVSLLLAD
jgi:hypothetical protein